jgi:hypothetical protein
MLVILVAIPLTGSASPPPRKQSQWHQAAKIKFQLDGLRPDGLRGLPDGLVAIAYEFCVPADYRVYQEVKRIDPTVQIHPSSRGRIGCSKNQTLCIGSTHQPFWREVLKELSLLIYIDEIWQCFFE